MNINRRPTKVFAVHGTWDFGQEAWFRKGSKFYEFAKQHNIFLTGSPVYDEAFEWSGDVNGLFFGSSKQHRDWSAGGIGFRHFIEQFPVNERNLIIHSHGLQIVAYASTRTDFNNIITIGSPIRKDMMNLYKNLYYRCIKWKHIYDKKWDRMGFLGQMFDGQWFGARKCPIEGVDNCEVAKISHSRILRDEKYMKLWVDNDWFDFLRS